MPFVPCGARGRPPRTHEGAWGVPSGNDAGQTASGSRRSSTCRTNTRPSNSSIGDSGRATTSNRGPGLRPRSRRNSACDTSGTLLRTRGCVIREGGDLGGRRGTSGRRIASTTCARGRHAISAGGGRRRPRTRRPGTRRDPGHSGARDSSRTSHPQVRYESRIGSTSWSRWKRRLAHVRLDEGNGNVTRL